MATTNRNKKAVPTVQCVKIDLPGEAVQCWRSSDNVQVVLRKHRDVIFELKISTGRTYTVESSGSDFYNADAKKLVPGKGAGRVSFNDGERLHLWVARDFCGEILLRSAGKLILKVEPQKFDHHKYDDNPKTKPVPIIIALSQTTGSTGTQPPSATLKPKISHESSPANIRPVAATIDEDCALVCIVDGFLKGMPDKLRGLIKEVSDKAQLIDLDPEDVVTKSWLLTQFSGAAAYVGDNWKWLRASLDGKRHDGFKLVKAKIHYFNGKARYVFSGYSKHNNVFGPGAFGPGHDRIVSIFSGAGKAGSMISSTFKGVAGTFKSNAYVSFIFGSALAVEEWKEDVSKDGYDLVAALVTNFIKAIVSAALTVLIVACLVLFIMFLVGSSLSVLAVGVLTIGVGSAIGFGVDVADKKLGKMIAGESNRDGLSAILAAHLRHKVEYHWDYLKRKVLWDYEEAIQ